MAVLLQMTRAESKYLARVLTQAEECEADPDLILEAWVGDPLIVTDAGRMSIILEILRERMKQGTSRESDGIIAKLTPLSSKVQR